MSLRICIVSNMLGRNRGYVTTQGQILADLLSKDGHTVISTSSRVNKLFRLLEIIWTIIKNRNRIDLLILGVYSGPYFIVAETASRLGRLFGIPMIFMLHGGNLPVFARRFPGWVERVFRRASILTAPSPFLAKGLSELGLPIRVVPNIVKVENYAFQLSESPQPRMIWMRSFHEIYNPQMALAAFRIIRDRHPEATLVMAGADKGLQPEIQNLAAEMGLKDSVRFPGFLNYDAKAREFAAADFFLNTNRVDNMPVSVVEACAVGLLVVATDVGGLSDLLTDGENGVLVADNDAAGMADAVERLLGDAVLSKKLSTNARLLAERSAWMLLLRHEWNALFEELLSEKAAVSNIKAPLGELSNS